MSNWSHDELLALANREPGWGVSFYMALHPRDGERRQDSIRLRHLLTEAERGLTANGLPRSQVTDLLRPAYELEQALPLAESIGKGLAIFTAPGLLRSYHCPVPFRDRVVIGQHLYLKPLVPLANEPDRFYVLLLSEKHVALLRGAAGSLTELAPDIPHSLKQAFESEEVEQQHQVRSIATGVGTGSRMALYYGQGEGMEDEKERLARFFAMVNRGVSKALRQEHAPLILAAVDYLVPIYRQVNDYAGLCQDFIAGNPDGWSTGELHERAHKIVRAVWQAPLERARARYQQFGGTPRACQILKDILPLAFQGRVDTLFLEEGVDRWGCFHPDTGALSRHDEAETGDEELLNLAALKTLIHEGQVYVLGAPEMPAGAIAAALLRY